jgi:predicted Rossmann fold nucleotide-binding protein DprA/Smf involved in DNA uptake
MILTRRVAVVGSRQFKNWGQLKFVLDKILEQDDELVSGGALGVDSMAQRYAKEFGYDIKIFYPKYARYGKPATFMRNKTIVENSDLVLAFYQGGRFQKGGTANTAEWANKLGVPLLEYEEELY